MDGLTVKLLELFKAAAVEASDEVLDAMFGDIAEEKSRREVKRVMETMPICSGIWNNGKWIGPDPTAVLPIESVVSNPAAEPWFEVRKLDAAVDLTVVHLLRKGQSEPACGNGGGIMTTLSQMVTCQRCREMM